MPIEQYISQIGFIFPKNPAENKKYLKPPPRKRLSEQLSLQLKGIVVVKHLFDYWPHDLFGEDA